MISIKECIDHVWFDTRLVWCSQDFEKKKFKLLAFSMWSLSFCLAGTYYHRKQPLLDARANPRKIFQGVS